jgi:hypothetical protein
LFGYVKRRLSPAGMSVLLATLTRGYEVKPDFLSRRYALNPWRGRSTKAPEKTMRAFRNFLLGLSLVLSALWGDDILAS